MTEKAALYLAALLHDAPDDLAIKANMLPKAVAPKQQLILQYATQIALGMKVLQASDRTSMGSIFQEVLVDEVQLTHSFQPSPFSLEENFFPQAGVQVDEKDITKLWADFDESAKGIKNPDSILTLLQQYTVRIPCGYKGAETVSYYDYAKIKAGIAIGLWEWWLSQEEGKEKLEPADQPLMLIAGDLSGIQEYIYDIVSKFAAKNLKGRSFYLQLLVSSILTKLIEELDLFQGNIVFDSGGGFNVLAPNLEGFSKKIEAFTKQVNDQLFEENGTVLFLGMDSIPLAYGNLLEDSISHYQRALNDKISAKKRQKHKSKALAFDVLFGDEVEKGGVQPRDVITGQEIRGAITKNKLLKEELGGPITEITSQQIILGRELKNLSYWLVSDHSLAKLGGSLAKFEFQPCKLGVYNYFLSDKDFKKHTSQLSQEELTIYVINDFITPKNIHLNPDQTLGFSAYGGTSFPFDFSEDAPKTFSEMAGAIEEEKVPMTGYGQAYEKTALEFKRLGILRMDVDDLGYIFRKGFQQTKLSLAKYATLSRSLDYFFKGYLNRIWETKDEFSSYTQIIYAGGDDLFIVGRWDLMIEMAQQVKKAFEDWTCDHPYIGISGGISIVTHKYPIMRAADMAGDAEKEAKLHRRFEERLDIPELEKKSITILGTPLHWKNVQYTEESKVFEWENEFEIVKKIKEELIDFIFGNEEKGIAKDSLPKGLLQRLMTLEAMRANPNEDTNPYRWQWVTAYYFSKMAQQLRKSKRIVSNYLENKSREIVLNQYNGKPLSGQSPHHFLSLFALAARWAELEKRQKAN